MVSKILYKLPRDQVKVLEGKLVQSFVTVGDDNMCHLFFGIMIPKTAPELSNIGPEQCSVLWSSTDGVRLNVI